MIPALRSLVDEADARRTLRLEGFFVGTLTGMLLGIVVMVLAYAVGGP